MSALLLLLAAAAVRGTLDAGVRSEARLSGSTGPSATSGEVSARPMAALRLQAPRWEVYASYSPNLTASGLGAQPDLSVHHQGGIGTSLRSKRLRVNFTEEGSVGTQSYSSLLITEDAASASRVEALPSVETITMISSRTSAAATFRANRRLTVDARFDYGLSGGFTGASRAVVPLQSGPRAVVMAEIAATRRDSARSALEASWTTFSSGQELALVTATEAWKHRFGRRTISTLAAGVAGGAVRASSVDSRRSVAYPIAEAAVEHRVPAKRIEMRFGVMLSPVLDRITGATEPRVAGDASVSFTPSRSQRFWGRAGATQSVAGREEGSLTLVIGELGAGLRGGKDVELVSGVRGVLQGRTGVEPLGFQWVAFAGLSYSAPRVRF